MRVEAPGAHRTGRPYQWCDRAARVWAAFFAAAERTAWPFVRDACFAAAERLAGERRVAALFACFDSAVLLAPAPLSRLSAPVAARARFAGDSVLGLRRVRWTDALGFAGFDVFAVVRFVEVLPVAVVFAAVFAVAADFLVAAGCLVAADFFVAAVFLVAAGFFVAAVLLVAAVFFVAVVSFAAVVFVGVAFFPVAAFFAALFFVAAFFAVDAPAFFALALPAGGGFSATPPRRAFDSPIATACFADRTPCLPSRTWSISSFTNAPACVLGALPSRFASRACSMVFLSGITVLLVRG